MTPEQRLDRIERIAKLLANAGMRARRDFRRDLWNHDHKINYLANLQINNEERFARLAEAQANLAESHATLAESQANTNRRLDALIDISRMAAAKTPHGTTDIEAACANRWIK